MKKILFIIAVLIIAAAHLRAQDDTIRYWQPVDSHYKPLEWPVISGIVIKEPHTHAITMNGWDTCNFIFNYPVNKMNWKLHADKDTVIFIVPPKHIIVGINSYTSMYLNGVWVLLMDSKNYSK